MREIAYKIGQREIKIVIGVKSSALVDQLKGRKILIRSKRVEMPFDFDAEYVVDDGEGAKNLENVLEIIRIMKSAGLGRSDFVVAVGGGTVMDVAGFAASIYMRGVGLVNVPTTILGMVDAGMGGKNAINFEGVKNLLGTFYQPGLIIDELNFLSTLPQDEYITGLAEVIKYGITLDKDLYDYMSSNFESLKSRDLAKVEEIVYRSTENKMKIVGEDELDNKGIRIVLNYGHTVGHALEAGSNFSIPHGKAVSVGMVCESKVAEELGAVEEGVVEDVLWLLQLYGLPISVDQLKVKVDRHIALNALVGDKKRVGGEILMPVPVRIGEWTKFKVPLETLQGLVVQCLE